MTVVGDHPTLAENVRHLWDLNLFDYFQIYPGVVPVEKNAIFIPLVGPSGAVEPSPPRTLTTPPNFLSQLVEFVETYPTLFTATNRFKGVLEYERLVDMVVGGKLALSFCSGGRNYFTLSPDDSVMPCHRLVGETRFQAGTGRTGLDAPLDQWRAPVDANPTCSQCWIRYLCGGGCKQENFLASGSLTEPNPEMCRYQIGLAEGVIRMLAAQEPAYRVRDRSDLDDLFVSCGRPVVASLRGEAAFPESLVHFAPV
jgi:radical SAM protein with 4Fe4S-binding SPASM domain